MKPFKEMVIIYIIMPKSKRKAIVRFTPRPGFRQTSGSNNVSFAKSNDLINGLVSTITSGKRVADMNAEYLDMVKKMEDDPNMKFNLLKTNQLLM